MPWKVFGKCVHKLNADGSKGERVECHETPEIAAMQVKALYANTKESERGIWPTLLESVSTNQKMDAVRSSFTAKFNPESSGMAVGKEYCYIRDFFIDEGYLIAEKGADLYRVDYTKKNGQYEFTSQSDWKKVQSTYMPVEESLRKEGDIRTGYFAFLSDLTESELDPAEFVARGVTLIKPGFSTNTDKAGRPRYYPADTLRQAASVFEGTRAYANHPRRSDEKELPERDVRDIVGYYENVKAADDGRLRGDFRVIGAARDWLWPLITETTRKPDLVELSINALGNTKLGDVEGRKSIVVESIVGANSVDVVTTGAAGGTFAGALLQSDPDGWTNKLLAAMPFEQWREARPDYIEKLKGEWKTVREMEALKAVKSKLTESQNEITRLKEAGRAEADELAQLRHAAHADRLLNSSTLPYKLRYEIREAVIAEADENGMAGVVAKATEAYAKSKPVVPVSGAGQHTSPPQPAVKLPNPVTQVFGISESLMALPDESAEDYRRRRQQQNLRG